MTSILFKRALAAGLSGAVVLTMASSAMAGRCGHSYAVDAPTTLTKVARACNVSLSALREANTGVDPDNVRPGEHLAVPDEIASVTDIPSGAATLSDATNGYSAPIYHYAEYIEPASGAAQATAQSDKRVAVSSPSPYLVQVSTAASFGARENETLSYQQRAAARIRHAGISRTPITSVVVSPVRSYVAPKSMTISTKSDLVSGEPVSPLMECAVLRRQANGKVAQVREFKPAPVGRDTPAHCAQITETSLAAPLKLLEADIASVFLRSEYEAGTPAAAHTVLKGYVSAADAECVTVRADDGMEWRVGVPLAPMEMLGKDATIWAEITDAPQCGGLVMSQAVYAERTD